MEHHGRSRVGKKNIGLGLSSGLHAAGFLVGKESFPAGSSGFLAGSSG